MMYCIDDDERNNKDACASTCTQSRAALGLGAPPPLSSSRPTWLGICLATPGGVDRRNDFPPSPSRLLRLFCSLCNRRLSWIRHGSGAR